MSWVGWQIIAVMVPILVVLASITLALVKVRTLRTTVGTTIWGKIKTVSPYLIIPMCVIALIVGAVVYASEEDTPTTSTAKRKKKFADKHHIEKLDEAAVDTFTTALDTSLDNLDRKLANDKASDLRKTADQFANGQISLDKARIAIRDSAKTMLAQKKYREETGRIGSVVLENKTESEVAREKASERDLLDGILDSNPLKFLLVIIIALSVLIAIAAIAGKVQIRGAILSATVIWLGYLVVVQIAKSDVWHDMGRKSSPGATAARQNDRVITRKLSETAWSQQVEVYDRKFDWRTPGWVEFKLIGSDYNTIKSENNVITITNKKGESKILPEFPPILPSGAWAFRLRGAPGTARITFTD